MSPPHDMSLWHAVTPASMQGLAGRSSVIQNYFDLSWGPSSASPSLLYAACSDGMLDSFSLHLPAAL